MSLDSGGGTPIPQKYPRVCHVCNARTRTETFCDSCGHPLCPSCTCEFPDGSAEARGVVVPTAATQAGRARQVDNDARSTYVSRRPSQAANAKVPRASKNPDSPTARSNAGAAAPRPPKAVPTFARKGTVTQNPFVLADRAGQGSMGDEEPPSKSVPNGKHSTFSDCVLRREDITVDAPWHVKHGNAACRSMSTGRCPSWAHISHSMNREAHNACSDADVRDRNAKEPSNTHDEKVPSRQMSRRATLNEATARLLQGSRREKPNSAQQAPLSMEAIEPAERRSTQSLADSLRRPIPLHASSPPSIPPADHVVVTESSKSSVIANNSDLSTWPSPPNPTAQPGDVQGRLHRISAASTPQLRSAQDGLGPAAGTGLGPRAGLRYTPEPHREVRRAAERPQAPGQPQEYRTEPPVASPASRTESVDTSSSRTIAPSTPSTRHRFNEPGTSAHPPIRAPGRPPHTGILSPAPAHESRAPRLSGRPRSESNRPASSLGITAPVSETDSEARMPARRRPASPRPVDRAGAGDESGVGRRVEDSDELPRPQPIMPPNHECDWKERYLALTAEVRHLKAEVTGRQQQQDAEAEGRAARRAADEQQDDVGLEALTIVMHMKGGREDLVINTDLRDVAS